MGTFDEMLIKAKELAKAASGKTEDMVEFTKLKLKLTQLKSDIEENYEKLGEIVYELRKADTENQELLEMCYSELDSQHAEMDELNKKLEELRHTSKCPSCKQPVTAQINFCPYCGMELNVAESTSQSQPEQPVHEEAPAAVSEASVTDTDEEPME